MASRPIVIEAVWQLCLLFLDEFERLVAAGPGHANNGTLIRLLIPTHIVCG